MKYSEIEWDVVVTTRNIWVANLVKQATEQFLEDRGLRLNMEKTSIKEMKKEHVTFLGVTFRWDEKLRIVPSIKVIDNIKHKLKSIIVPSLSPLEIIESLNPVIRGWANAYNFCDCMETFDDLDYYVWQLLKKWVLRKHGRVYLKPYFEKEGKRWVFISQKEKEKVYLLSFYSIKRVIHPARPIVPIYKV
jgi:RNA-directed DNA polymerase